MMVYALSLALPQIVIAFCSFIYFTICAGHLAKAIFTKNQVRPYSKQHTNWILIFFVTFVLAANADYFSRMFLAS